MKPTVNKKLKKNINKQLSKEIKVNSDSENLDMIVETKRVKKSRQKVRKGFYYSFLTIVLLFCLIQVGFGAILNISKTISYKSKINTLEEVRDKAEARNQDLKQDIKLFSSTTTLEGIARNNLKMAGEDEVLVIINNSEQKDKQVQTKKKSNKKKEAERLQEEADKKLQSAPANIIAPD